MSKALLTLGLILLPAFSLLADPPQRLYGTWKAEQVSTPLGEVRIRLEFTRKKNADVTAWSTMPLVGEVRDTSGSFKVDDGRLISTAIHGGTSVEYWFENGVLVIRYDDGKTVRFLKEEAQAKL